jgi:hypothetical protein
MRTLAMCVVTGEYKQYWHLYLGASLKVVLTVHFMLKLFFGDVGPGDDCSYLWHLLGNNLTNKFTSRVIAIAANYR